MRFPADRVLRGRRTSLAAPDQHGDNQARAAAELGIGAPTLYRELRSYTRRVAGK
ncbi:helix-turn-helix domain-containing protein [Sorangium sp. So ce131]|uniref:helix-turn-helix domain-containing protein n=1 Tax=Sorangium sp. So ce131 TaxID=3133282 RepID=UPI003F626712